MLQNTHGVGFEMLVVGGADQNNDLTTVSLQLHVRCPLWTHVLSQLQVWGCMGAVE